MRYRIAVFGLLALFVTSCSSVTHTARLQKPFYKLKSADSPELAVVSVEVPEPVRKRASESADKIRKQVVTELGKAMSVSPFVLMDRTDSSASLSIQPIKAPPSPRTSFRASDAPTIPKSIEAPLVLFVEIIDWKIEQDGASDAEPNGPQATVDIAYSLWTRSAEEIDTRRVRVRLGPAQKLLKGISVIPRYPPAMGLKGAMAFDSKTPSDSTSKLLEQSVRGNTHAYAWPFGKHRVRFEAKWDDSVDAVSRGIELAKKRKFEKAAESWKKVVERNDQNAAAYYNLGVISEIQGNTERALEYYTKAMQIKAKSQYVKRWQTLKKRRAHWKSIRLGGAAPSATDSEDKPE